MLNVAFWRVGPPPKPPCECLATARLPPVKKKKKKRTTHSGLRGDFKAPPAWPFLSEPFWWCLQCNSLALWMWGFNCCILGYVVADTRVCQGKSNHGAPQDCSGIWACCCVFVCFFPRQSVCLCVRLSDLHIAAWKSISFDQYPWIMKRPDLILKKKYLGNMWMDSFTVHDLALQFWEMSWKKKCFCNCVADFV